MTKNPTVLIGEKLRAYGDLDNDVRILIPKGRVAFVAVEREGGLTHILAIQNTTTGIKVIATDRENELIKQVSLLDRDLMPS
jgi:hypothetical protein